MARKRGKTPPPLKLPARLTPNFDAWGSPAEERKRARRDAWLTERGLTEPFYFPWVTAYLAERRRLAGLPPRPAARRKGKLPEDVRRLLSTINTEGKSDE